VSRRQIYLGLVVVLLVVGGLTVRNIVWEPPSIPPNVEEPRSGIHCFRAGGDPSYCRCLDRLDSARDEADVPRSTLPPMDDPAVRYALRHPHEFPIINADTPRCLAAPGLPRRETA
jgi:hypothetical protein